MRRMGQSRKRNKSPIPGMTIGLTVVFIISMLVTVRGDRLVEAALGKQTKASASKVSTRDDHPDGAERDFLKTLINQAMEATE